MTDEELSELQVGFYRSLDLAVNIGRVQNKKATVYEHVKAQSDTLRHMCDALHYGGLYLVERLDRLERPGWTTTQTAILTDSVAAAHPEWSLKQVDDEVCRIKSAS
jgi:hypothetical protein